MTDDIVKRLADAAMLLASEAETVCGELDGHPSVERLDDALTDFLNLYEEWQRVQARK